MKLSILMISLISNEFRRNVAERAIDHLIEYSTDFEFIYIDNASPFEIKNKEKIDIYVKNKENIGITRAFNQAYKLARGDIILFVDNDVDVKQDWQKNILPFLNEFDAISLERIKNYEDFQKQEKQNIKISKKLNYKDCFWLINRHVFEKIGLLDENIFCYHEGLDFFIRMCKNGFNSSVLSGEPFWHLHSEMPYIENEIKVKDIKYLEKKWNLDLSTNLEGLRLGTQLYNQNKNQK